MLDVFFLFAAEWLLGLNVEACALDCLLMLWLRGSEGLLEKRVPLLFSICKLWTHVIYVTGPSKPLKLCALMFNNIRTDTALFAIVFWIQKMPS